MKHIIRYFLFVPLLLFSALFAHNDEKKEVSHAQDDAYWAALAKNYPRYTPSLQRRSAKVVPPYQAGQWGEIIDWPHIPVSAANLPDGRLITWASNKKTSFPRGVEYTYATLWNPKTGQFTEKNNTYHDMFCSHLSLLEDGRLFVTGGTNWVKTTSIFDYRTNQWSRSDDMGRGRWYPTNVTLPSGQVFSALGSGGGRYPELWTEGQGWKVLTGISLQDPILQYDAFYERAWWPLLHLAPQGNIFHSGPTPQMHSISTKALGSVTQVGDLIRDWYPKHGTTVMFDKGKLLVAGGAISGVNQKSSHKAMVIDINAATPKITPLPSMQYARKFHNSVMLPTGDVLVIGGNTSGVKFNDQGSILPPELWNPKTQQWKTLAPSSVPRNYHSVALLLTDGSVISGGGGLCDCAADHQNAQRYSPPYLFNQDGSKAQRPLIIEAPKVIRNGETFTLKSDTDIERFSLIKMSATTHAVNTDLRFLSPKFSRQQEGGYRIIAAANKNVLTAGYWMLFAINRAGVPSVARIIQVTTLNGLKIEQLTHQSHRANHSLSLKVKHHPFSATGGVFSAQNIPIGLVINKTTGTISGTPTAVGDYNVTLQFEQAGLKTAIQFSWRIYRQGKVAGVSYEYYQGEGNHLPDFNQLAAQQKKVKYGVVNHFNLPSSITTQGAAVRLSAQVKLAKADHYTFYLRSQGISRLWVDGKRLLDNESINEITEQTVVLYLTQGEHHVVIEYLNTKGLPYLNLSYSNQYFKKKKLPRSILSQSPFSNVAPHIFPVVSQKKQVGNFVAFSVIANDANGDLLRYSAAGLPKGLSINASTGIISGTSSKIGDYNVVIVVTDTKGKKTSITMAWHIVGKLQITPIIKPPKPLGRSIIYNVQTNSQLEVEYKWQFGDGTPTTAYSTSEQIQHRFTQAGNYKVTVIAKDKAGNKATYQFGQSVYLPMTTGRAKSSMSIVYNTHAESDHLWNVNPDNQTVTGFNATLQTKIVEIKVGETPRALAFSPKGTLWVTNKTSATVSIIDTQKLEVIRTIKLPTASQPHGIIFSEKDNTAYIALEATGEIIKIAGATGKIITRLAVGNNPRHLTLNAAENKLYVSRYITPPLPSESNASPQTQRKGIKQGGEVVVVGLDPFHFETSIVLQHSNRQDSEHSARGLPNYLGAVALSPDGLSGWVPSKQDNIKRGKYRDGLPLTHDNTVRSITSKINTATAKELPSARVDHDNGGLASAATFARYGNYLFVALESSREIAVVDAYNHDTRFRIKTERAPQGLVISPDGLTLYSHNFMDRSITAYDLYGLIYTQSDQAPLTVRFQTVSKERLSARVLRGKQFFYDGKDTRLAKNGYMSCASCHNEGRDDGRVWDLTQVGEGLRNTISLVGRGGMDHGLLHWSGNFDEVQDFEGQIRTLSGGTGLMTKNDFHHGTRDRPLGEKKTGVSQALDDLAAYITSLKAIPKSPYRNQQAAQVEQGQRLFVEKGCLHCHSGQYFTDSAPNNLHDIGTLKTSSGKRLQAKLKGIDTPTLLGVWQTAPYLHNGSALTLIDAIKAHKDTVLTDNERIKLSLYLRQLEAGDKVTVTRPEAKPKVKKSGGSVSFSLLFFIVLMSFFVLYRRVNHFV